MFGLDARITLVIIGTLSIVTSAVMMSTVGETVATQYANDLKSVATAYQNFKMDTGYNVSNYSSDGSNKYYKISELLSLTADSNKPYTLRFNGPYIDYNSGSNNSNLTHPSEGYSVYLASRSYKNGWANFTNKCSSNDCFVWVEAQAIESDVARDIDVLIDGIADSDKGKVRTESAGTGIVNLFYAIERE